jgi:hypothetical protein
MRTLHRGIDKRFQTKRRFGMPTRRAGNSDTSNFKLQYSSTDHDRDT